MPHTIQFILTPDASTSRRLRRLLAEESALLGVVVGTWGELLAYALRAYNEPMQEDLWEAVLEETLPQIPDPFWQGSLEVAPEEVKACLKATLAMLLEAVTGSELPEDKTGHLSERGRRHLEDLARLHRGMGKILPADLEAITRLLDADGGTASFRLQVNLHPEWPRLSSRQQLLVKKLAADFGSGNDQRISSLLASLHSSDSSSYSGNLDFLQRYLFRDQAAPTSLDGSLQCLLVRDHLEEVEVVAGMIQTAMSEDKSLSAADIAILLPDNSVYPATVRDVFEAAGIPLSGLPLVEPIQDAGHEAVYCFLRSLCKPAPRMAVAALLASPLMPWDAARGAWLAQKYMDQGEMPEELALCQLLNAKPQDSSDLRQLLKTFSTILSAARVPERHLARARELIGTLGELLSGHPLIPWIELLRRSAPQQLTSDVKTDFTREGVTVFTDRQEPWRSCRILFVLGFSSGSYPRPSSSSAVFSADDLIILKNDLGYNLELPADYDALQRQLFIRQLAAATEGITFLIPRRDGKGGTLHPSETLTFMSGLFTQHQDYSLLFDLDRSEDRDNIRWLPPCHPSPPELPRLLLREDLQLDADLFALRVDDNGKQKTESPSSLENLLVSPLAWLFSRFGLEPRQWSPDELDVLLKGSLAHAVFEGLFVPDAPVPDENAIRSRIPELYDTAISEMATFLAGEEWQVERRHLAADIEKAALRWGEMLQGLNARVLATETGLSGCLDDLPIAGRADLLLELTGKRLLVVDYKKSGSSSRIERMNKGYDCQAELYRIMLQTGTDGERDDCLRRALEGLTGIGVMYYLMNDQTALADSNGWSGGKVAGFREIAGSISSEAMKLLKKRIGQIRSGFIELNSVNDEEFFKKKAGITPYAFDNNPLVRLFMKEG